MVWLTSQAVIKKVKAMLPDIFESVDYLQKGLQASQLRADTLANNIANVDTPGFKASHVEFEAYMKQALEGESRLETSDPDDGHEHIRRNAAADLADVTPAVIQDTSTTMRLDGNNVDIDNEMVQLAKNSIYYNTLVKKLNGEVTRLKLAIDGR
jgi:flagellar basal-body rod protein FlgB